MARKAKKKSKLDKLTNEDEKILHNLNTIKYKIKDEATRVKVIGLESWYIKNHWWTPQQKRLAMALIEAQERTQKLTKKINKQSCCYVYLVSDGDAFKLGIAKNVTKRLGGLRVGCSRELEVLCKYKFKSKDEAFKVEQNSHRELKAFSIRGEWFKIEAVDIAKDFIENHELFKKEDKCLKT